jgi:uncharacterized protein (DUF1800 family)
MNVARATGTTAALVAAVVAIAPARAQAPPEVGGVRFGPARELAWDPAGGASAYNVYRGSAAQLQAGRPPRCHVWNTAATTAPTPAPPPAGDAFVYLVTATSAGGEGTPGADSGGATRAVLGDCRSVMQHHLLSRITYGWNEYVAARLAALGPQGFLEEQLDPAGISEATNDPLNTRLSTLTAPEDQLELMQRQATLAVYARRQLEQVVAEFWNNHFSTNFSEVFDTYVNANITADAQYREMENFRKVAFTGTFRQLVERSALGPAMIPYLDTTENIAGVPNENYARELMELHTMGVDGGYTQADVREMARVWTGWTVCRKVPPGNPLDPCQLIGGQYKAHFDATKHDCGAKTLFPGTPQQKVIAATCDGGGLPTTAGVNDAYQALDAVATHPSTKRFIAKKLLRGFITEEPSEAEIQSVVDRWTATGGNNLEVLRSVLSYDRLMDPDIVGNKVRTPFEHIPLVLRAIAGDTHESNAGTMYNYLARMQMLPHQAPAPTGYPELARDWVNTNDLLERQNFAWDALTQASFFEDVIPLLAARGLSAASPPQDLVDFYADVLFGRQLTPFERERAVAFLTTDDAGLPAAVDDARVKKMVAYLMGFPQLLEQ